MDYLYHYTDVDVLALILFNKTIRFNSLDNMDDLQEKEVADIKNIGQFCYVSSWTDDPDESIAMWKMYCSWDSGVWIKIRRYPFHEFVNDPKSLITTGMPVIGDETDGDYPKSVIPYAEFINNGFTQHPPLQKNMLFKVTYTDDKKMLYPNLVSQDEKSINIATGMLGKYKNTYWKFQREWRYIFLAFPFDVKKIEPENDNYMRQINNKLLSGDIIHPFDYYDLTLAEEAFEDMEIMMGPGISNGNRLIVSDLIEKYNPAASLIESELIGKIK